MSSQVFSMGRNGTWAERCAELSLPVSIVAVAAAGLFALAMMLHAARLGLRHDVEILPPIAAQARATLPCSETLPVGDPRAQFNRCAGMAPR